jgi:hypothetical protein
MALFRAAVFCLFFLGFAGIGENADAQIPWEAGGFAFSDELGGFEITGLTGSGSADDPIVIHQRLDHVAPAVLVIRPLALQGAPVDLFRGPFLRLSIVTVVTNASRRVWNGFDLELQEELGQPSVHGDGLSFDQMKAFGERYFVSDRFAITTDSAEPYDRVRFHQGKVDPGERVSFQIYILDVSPNEEFYLVQEPQLLVVERHLPKEQRFVLLHRDSM